jgi:hypothetical protein
MAKDYASAGFVGVDSAFYTRQFVGSGAGILDPLGLDTGLPHAGMTAVGGVGFVGWAKLACLSVVAG